MDIYSTCDVCFPPAQNSKLNSLYSAQRFLKFYKYLKVFQVIKENYLIMLQSSCKYLEASLENRVHKMLLILSTMLNKKQYNVEIK